MTLKIYLGGPLFSEAEKAYNQYLEDRIVDTYGELVSVYNPMSNQSINDKSGYANSIDIFKGDNVYLEEADLLIAQLDGAVIDPGLASEIGFFHSLNRPILGLYSDSRQGHYNNQGKIDALEEVAESQFSYINLYVVGAVKDRGEVFKTSDQLVEAISQYIEED